MTSDHISHVCAYVYVVYKIKLKGKITVLYITGLVVGLNWYYLFLASLLLISMQLLTDSEVLNRFYSFLSSGLITIRENFPLNFIMSQILTDINGTESTVRKKNVLKSIFARNCTIINYILSHIFDTKSTWDLNGLLLVFERLLLGNRRVCSAFAYFQTYL